MSYQDSSQFVSTQIRYIANVPNLGTQYNCTDTRYMKKTIATQEYSDFIDWLITGREARGLSMRALAEKLHLPHSFVQKIESRERRLDVYEFIQYCEALDLDPNEGLKLLSIKRKVP